MSYIRNKLPSWGVSLMGGKDLMALQIIKKTRLRESFLNLNQCPG